MVKFMPQKKSKPKFLRPNYGRSSRARVKGNWRRQRGEDNKKRVKKAHMGKSPSIGYGQDKRIRCLHPVGKKEALIHNMAELAAVKDEAVRIASGVAKRLKASIVAEAEKRKLIVLNSGKKKLQKAAAKKEDAATAKG